MCLPSLQIKEDKLDFIRCLREPQMRLYERNWDEPISVAGLLFSAPPFLALVDPSQLPSLGYFLWLPLESFKLHLCFSSSAICSAQSWGDKCAPPNSPTVYLCRRGIGV